jgi:hypothetical protein
MKRNGKNKSKREGEDGYEDEESYNLDKSRYTFYSKDV